MRIIIPIFICLLLIPVQSAHSFVFIFAGTSNGLDIVTHPIGYTGVGGTFQISVGIVPGTENATAMAISVQNVVNTINKLLPANNNLVNGGNNNIPPGQIDFESVLLHEMGHSLGLGHVNLASESGLTDPEWNFTKSTRGVNGVFDLDAGPDGIIGSEDDFRGDDENLNYFKVADNNPFDLAGVIDATTYSRDLGDLPNGGFYSTNADRNVAANLFFLSNTECVMQQGSFFDEAQRLLSADDVAGLRYAMAGLDEINGTADDYSFELVYVGESSNADISISFDATKTSFAVSESLASLFNGHAFITSNDIFFDPGNSWFFNTAPNLIFPVELIAFEAEKKVGKALLSWATSSELNSSHFDVQLSFDGLAWENLGRVDAAGNSQNTLHYSFSDVSDIVPELTRYYRLKEVDKNGSFSFSNVIELNFVESDLNDIAFAVNPFTDATYFEWSMATEGATQFRLFDLQGKVIYEQIVQAKRGYNRYDLGKNVTLDPGIYILHVETNDYLHSEKIIKQKE